MKRAFDILVSLAVLTLFAPVLAVVALAIYCRMGPPVLFVQQRPGLQGKPFAMIKFRTMANAKDAAGNDLPDSDRMTGLGRFLRKTSLDEMPEFWNVLKGDMSVVGPRPLLMEYVPLYSAQQARRHEVRPGITGWAQVNGRNAVDWDERFKLDVWYVDHGSLALDIRIIWMTLLCVLRREGINAEGEATMAKFTGSRGE